MIRSAGSAGRLLWVAGLLCLLLAGCRTAADGGGIPIAPTAAENAPEPAEHTPTPATPLAPPHLEGPSPTVAAVNTAAPPPTPTSIHTSTPNGARPPAVDATGAAPTAGPSPTPMPTFTPPPPPPALEGQQLWLQRPVPASGPAWTDKAYPYGSTRGGALRPHTGVEFIVPTGTPVLAAAAGTVLVAGDDSLIAHGPQTNFYGLLVIVEHDTSDGSSLYTLYGHLSEVSVVAGQRVAAGDMLGLSGATGVADGPHLHFEVRVGMNSYGATRNPLLWLRPLPQTGVVAGRVVGPTGELLHQAPVALIRVDGPAPYTATTTYAPGDPNSDDALGENFVLDDVVPGFYEAVVDTGRERFKTELWVYADGVNWVKVVVAP